MTEDEKRVACLVRDAFRDVALGEGVGLLQGQGLDDYADFRTLENYRLRDEKFDWAKISSEDLNRCHSSLSFFDAEGMRFHLPAYLIADLEGDLNHDMIFHLAWSEQGALDRFGMLSDSQRNAVREFLLLRLSNPNCEFERPMIEKALREYWKESEKS